MKKIFVEKILKCLQNYYFLNEKFYIKGINFHLNSGQIVVLFLYIDSVSPYFLHMRFNNAVSARII